MSPTSVRALKPFMGRYANVILDLDGCVWIGAKSMGPPRLAAPDSAPGT